MLDKSQRLASLVFLIVLAAFAGLRAETLFVLIAWTSFGLACFCFLSTLDIIAAGQMLSDPGSVVDGVVKVSRRRTHVLLLGYLLLAVASLLALASSGPAAGLVAFFLLLGIISSSQQLWLVAQLRGEKLAELLAASARIQASLQHVQNERNAVSLERLREHLEHLALTLNENAPAQAPLALVIACAGAAQALDVKLHDDDVLKVIVFMSCADEDLAFSLEQAHQQLLDLLSAANTNAALMLAEQFDRESAQLAELARHAAGGAEISLELLVDAIACS